MDPDLATAALVLALLLAGVVTGVRIVPVGSCAVVTRPGRLRKVVPAGLAFVFPLVDRLEEMPGAQPIRTEPVPVRATTRDGHGRSRRAVPPPPRGGHLMR
jgi:regulator of protease activity HflC (stomatin/prohibitin superfamily)